MARITIEDCNDKVPNRFELVHLAAYRARSIADGMPITIERDNDKNGVVALREIAEETIRPDDIKEALINSNQEQVELDDEPEAEATPAREGFPPMPILGQDHKADDALIDRMSEAELLRGLESLEPPEVSGHNPRGR